MLKPRILKSILLTALLMLSCSAWASSDVKLSVEMPRGKRAIEVGDVFYINISVSGTSDKLTQPQNVPGANILFFQTSHSSSISVDGRGNVTQSVKSTSTLTLRATKEGNYTFGPIKVGGSISNIVKYSIRGAGSTPAATPQTSQRNRSQAQQQDDASEAPKFIGKGNDDLFMRASISKTTAYEQEALVYTVKLYSSTVGVKFVGAAAAPTFDGFVVEECPNTSNQLMPETYNGKEYASIEIARYIIFPQRSGTLKVTGNTYTVSADAQDFYQDPFWGNMAVRRPIKLNVTPNDLTVTVKALPQPQPADFSGGVGKFSITSTLPTSNLKSNLTANVIYKVTGTGNIKYLHLPDLNGLYPKELEVYTPTTDVNAKVTSTNVTGTVTFDYSFMPMEAGRFTIPDVKLVYFNPESGSYETAEAHGWHIDVAQGEASAKSQTKSKLKFDESIVSGGHPKKSHHPFINGLPYWLFFFILPSALLAGSWFWYRSWLKMHADEAALRRRKARKAAKARLKKASQALARKDYESFYTVLLECMWGYLGDKLHMAPSELSRDNIKDVLVSNGVEEPIVDKLITFLDKVEFAKYAPSAPHDEPNVMFDEAADLINDIDAAFQMKRHTEEDASPEALHMPTRDDIKKMNKELDSDK